MNDEQLTLEQVEKGLTVLSEWDRSCVRSLGDRTFRWFDFPNWHPQFREILAGMFRGNNPDEVDMTVNFSDGCVVIGGEFESHHNGSPYGRKETTHPIELVLELSKCVVDQLVSAKMKLDDEAQRLEMELQKRLMKMRLRDDMLNLLREKK